MMNGVAALQRHHRLVDGRRRRVRRGADGADNTDRLAVFDDAVALVLVDHPDGAGAHQVAERAEGLAGVLDDLALDIAKAGILDGELGQHAGILGLIDRPGERRDRLVDAGLVMVLVRLHGGAGARDERPDLPGIGLGRVGGRGLSLQGRSLRGGRWLRWTWALLSVAAIPSDTRGDGHPARGRVAGPGGAKAPPRQARR